MTQEWMQKTLVNLGFTEIDAEVYVFLLNGGPRKASDIAEALRIYKRRLYRILRKLQGKGIVNSSSEYPTRFSAVLFEEVLDLFIKFKTEQQEAIQESKKELLSTWRVITEKGDEKS